MTGIGGFVGLRVALVVAVDVGVAVARAKALAVAVGEAVAVAPGANVGVAVGLETTTIGEAVGLPAIVSTIVYDPVLEGVSNISLPSDF